MLETQNIYETKSDIFHKTKFGSDLIWDFSWDDQMKGKYLNWDAALWWGLGEGLDKNLRRFGSQCELWFLIYIQVPDSYIQVPCCYIPVPES